MTTWKELLEEAYADAEKAWRALGKSQERAVALARLAAASYRDDDSEAGRKAAADLYNESMEVRRLEIELDGCNQWAARCKQAADEEAG